jgi:hypothetical protein
MHQIHPNVRTTPAVRAEITRFSAPTGLLAQRYGVSTETTADGAGVALPTASTAPPPPQLALEGHCRRARCGLPAARKEQLCLDDLTFVVRHFLPHINRDSIWHILKAEGLNRRRPAASERPARGTGKFRLHSYRH